MKVAILYICTGKYDVFWEGFYESSEKFFLPSSEKEYFVFSDSKKIEAIQNNRIHYIHFEKLGWPFDTLMRFKLFSSIQKQLLQFDYVFFLNANMRFLKKVDIEILPTKEEGGLLAVLHPHYYNKTASEFTYDRNPKSRAYIPLGQGKHYFMGGFNGGIATNFIKLINSLKKQIEEDLEENVIALWHDESHLNHYLLTNKCKALDASYGVPEGLDLPFDPKIIILDKSKFGGHNLLRGIEPEIDSTTKKRKSVVVKLMGGLGNQMFQYAFAKHLAQTYNLELKIDEHFLLNKATIDTPRDYELEVFQLNLKKANLFELAKFTPAVLKNGLLRYLYKKVLKHKSSQIITESTYSFNENLKEKVTKNIYLNGFWQSEKYFKESEQIIRADFTFPEQISGENQAILSKIQQTNSVSIHIRRGDYVSNKNANAFHGTCSLDYYKAAIELVTSKVTNPNFFVFSDEPEWVKNHFFKNIEYTIISHNTGVKSFEDMRLMSNCKHNIIANSSFSWWGAWLNSNNNKIVICPQKWFADTSHEIIKNLIPESWIKL